MSTPAASAASKLASVLPGAMRSAPLWPMRLARVALSSGTTGTSMSGGCRPTARAGGSARRSAGTAGRRGRRSRGSASGCRPCADCCIRGRVHSTMRSASSSLTRPAGRQGSTPAAKQPSTFHRLPMPATVRWSSSASPIGRVGSSSRRRRRKRARSASPNSGPRMSGPERREALVDARARRGQQLEHGPVELHDLVARRAQHEPGAARRAPPAPALAVGAPTSRSCAGGSG